MKMYPSVTRVWQTWRQWARWLAIVGLSLAIALGLSPDAAHSQALIDSSLPPIAIGLDPSTDSPGRIPTGLSVSPDPVADGERGIVGSDDRVLMTSAKYPWSAIGRLEQLDIRRGFVRNWCTATLIARDLVLTNAHCVIDIRTGRLSPAELVFRPNMIRGQSSDRTNATVLDYGTNFADGKTADDWALLRIEDPLGDYYGEVGWLASELDRPQVLATLNEKLHLAGYSGDFPSGVPGYEPGETPGVHTNCSITDLASDGRFLHACDTNGGASGAPLIGRLDSGEFVILGLHAGRTQENDETINYGMRVDRWQELARQYATGEPTS
ncbi:MAG: trypsin-like serine peptidase [Geitlerinemataceae cyanobacterium]